MEHLGSWHYELKPEISPTYCQLIFKTKSKKYKMEKNFNKIVVGKLEKLHVNQ